jgi:hypothetical protein
MSACGDAAFAKPGITNVTPIKHVARSASSLFMTDSLRLSFRIYPITVQGLACCDLVAECNGPVRVAEGLERGAGDTLLSRAGMCSLGAASRSAMWEER